MAEKRIAHGARLKKGATLISQVKNFTPPAFEREEVEAVTLDSDVEDTIPGDPPSVGELRFLQVWTPGDTNHELLDAAALNKTIESYTIEWPMFSVPKKDTFSAWVKRLGPEQFESKSAITREVVLKLTTVVTRTDL